MNEKRERCALVAAELAHEVRNVFMVVMSCAEAMRLELPPHSDAQAALDDLLGSAERATTLSRRLLTMAAQVADRDTPVDVMAVVTARIATLERLAPPGVTVTLEAPAAPPLRSTLAASDLEQVIFNLVNNAFDAMPDGGAVHLQMRRVSLVGRPGYLELCVRDTGHGMDAETLARCFEPFFTTKGTRGTGIGLHAVREVVERAGGRITVESAPGKTVFCLYLPLVEDAAAP